MTAFIDQYSCSSAVGRGFSNGSESKFSISCARAEKQRGKREKRRGETGRVRMPRWGHVVYRDRPTKVGLTVALYP